MNLQKLTEFRLEHFTGKRPDLRTLRKWPGVEKRGGEYYIDLDALARHGKPTPAKPGRKRLKPEREALVDRIVHGG